MLYATTRSKVATYTAQRALKEDRAPDGGFYVPTELPVFSREELSDLLKQPAGEIAARVLNLFFNSKLGQLDVEFAVGRRLFGLAKINHRIFIGELWSNECGDFDGLCTRLAQRICVGGLIDRAAVWMRIACRVALTFTMFGQLKQQGHLPSGELLDCAVLTGDFEGPYALWTAKRMGLDVGQIICCCNENGGFWDLLNRGQMKLGAKTSRTSTPKCDTAVPAALELLIRDKLEWDDVEEFLSLQKSGGTYYLNPEEHRHFREGFSAAVVSDRRVELAIPNLYNTNGYILCPYSALVYTGLMDYRSRPGPRRAALMLSDFDPRASEATVMRALALSDRELRDWCRRG